MIKFKTTRAIVYQAILQGVSIDCRFTKIVHSDFMNADCFKTLKLLQFLQLSLFFNCLPECISTVTAFACCSTGCQTYQTYIYYQYRKELLLLYRLSNLHLQLVVYKRIVVALQVVKLVKLIFTTSSIQKNCCCSIGCRTCPTYIYCQQYTKELLLYR